MANIYEYLQRLINSLLLLDLPLIITQKKIGKFLDLTGFLLHW